MQALWPRRAELRWNRNRKILGSLRRFSLLLMSVDLTSQMAEFLNLIEINKVCLPGKAMTETTTIWQFMLPTWIFTLQPQTCLAISFYWLDSKMGLSLSLFLSLSHTHACTRTHTHSALVEFTTTIRLAAWSVWRLWRSFQKSARLMTRDCFTSQSFCLSAWVGLKI